MEQEILQWKHLEFVCSGPGSILKEHCSCILTGSIFVWEQNKKQHIEGTSSSFEELEDSVREHQGSSWKQEIWQQNITIAFEREILQTSVILSGNRK